MHQAWAAGDLHTRLVVTANNNEAIGQQEIGRRWLVCKMHRYSPEQQVAALGTFVKPFYHVYYELLGQYPERFAAYFDALDVTAFDMRVTPVTEQSIEYESRSIPAVVRSLLEQAISSGENPDITPKVVLKPAMVQLLGTLKDDGEEAIVQVAKMPKSERGLLVEAALVQLGFRPVGHRPTERVSAPFQLTSKPSVTTVFVAADERQGEQERASRFVKRLLERRARPEDNVVAQFPRQASM